MDLNAIMAEVELVQKRARQRTISESDVIKAIKYLEENPEVEEVRIDGGAVPNSYGSKAEATYLWLCHDGRFKVSRKWARTVPYGDQGQFSTTHKKMFKDQV